MRITSPQSGDVLEQGAEVTLSASFGPEHAGEAFHVSIADGRSWSGRWWRSVAENVRAAPDGFVSVRYRVPRDLVAPTREPARGVEDESRVDVVRGHA